MLKFLKIATASLLVFSLASPTAFAENNSVDVDAPRILSINASTDFVAPGETISFEVAIQDASEIKLASIKVEPLERDSLYQNIFLKYDEATQKYVGSYNVPLTAFNEKWYVSQVSASDIHGNYDSLSNQGYSWDNWQSTVQFQIFDGNDKIKPQLHGIEAVETAALQPFLPLNSVTATDDIDGDVTSKIQVSGEVNTQKEGVYTLTYSVTDKAGNTTTSERRVEVIDKDAPVFQMPANDIVYQGTNFGHLDDIKAMDTYEGDISSKIIVEKAINLNLLGQQKIIYSVTDSRGNKTTQERSVTVVQEPVMVFKGAEDIAILKNSVFNSTTGVQVSEDGQDITKKLQTSGIVDSTKLGVYEVTYTVKNKAQQTITHKRNVHIVESLEPYFVGVDDVIQTEGKAFDHLHGVIAYNALGKKIYNVSTSYGGNLTDVGTYTIRYEATDEAGSTVKVDRTLTITEASTYFTDVPSNHMYFKEIQAMKDLDIINGYTDGTFKPTTNISRQHVAALISRSGIDLTPVRPATTFKDVPETHRYYNEIMKLYRAGIIDGSNGYFNPNGELKRAHLAKILVNAFKLDLVPTNVHTFSDMNGSWATPYVNILASNNVTTGSNGKFMPNQTVSRQHYATFMYRILKK